MEFVCQEFCILLFFIRDHPDQLAQPDHPDLLVCQCVYIANVTRDASLIFSDYFRGPMVHLVQQESKGHPVLVVAKDNKEAQEKQVRKEM